MNYVRVNGKIYRFSKKKEMFKTIAKHGGAECYIIPNWIEHIVSMDDKDRQRLEIERMINMIEQAEDYKKRQ